MRGYGILFNTEALCYDFWEGEIRETIEPTALQDTDLTDVYLIGGHNIEPDKVIARTGINLRLEVDETGLFFEAEMPNTQYARDIYNLVESGIVDGMSFGFDSPDMDNIDREKHTRTITKITKLYEISITPFPAYKEASVIAQQERQAEENKQKEEDAEKAKLDAENKEKNLKELEELLDD